MHFFPKDNLNLQERWEWHDVDLQLCEKGRRVDNYLPLACRHLTVPAFNKLISNVSFGHGFSESSELNILFKVIQSGELGKLRGLRGLPSYDQIPLNLRDRATGKTTLDMAKDSGNVCMTIYVRSIITKQQIELHEGIRGLEARGYRHQM